MDILGIDRTSFLALQDLFKMNKEILDQETINYKIKRPEIISNNV
jgi:hypothetical protein